MVSSETPRDSSRDSAQPNENDRFDDRRTSRIQSQTSPVSIIFRNGCLSFGNSRPFFHSAYGETEIERIADIRKLRVSRSSIVSF